MCSVSSDVDDEIKIFSGSLIVGNHDSITLFGIHPQNALKTYSRRVTDLLLKETAELDMTITDVLSEIEHFETKTQKLTKSFWGNRIHHKEIQREYTKILSYIESMTLYFKLQQAQMIKEIKLLEKLSSAVALCSEELEQCILVGKQALCNRTTTEQVNKGQSLDISSDTEVWYARLEKRIADLSVSHMLSLQSQAQIKMLHDNNLQILDRIAATISNTFPLWQNQMATMLGVELMEARLNIQNKLVNMNDKYVAQMATKTKHRKGKSIQFDKLFELNHSLSESLIEMVQLEKTNDVLRREFLDTVDHTERG
jgi:uncharacterized protein YaaN involved in tellurite resistance